MKILVSGFQRFLDYPVNTSEVMAGLLSHEPDVRSVVLPVSYREAFIKLKSEIEAHDPDVVLCLGLAAKRPCISLEKIGVNIIDCDFADNDGTVYRHKVIQEKGPPAYFATLPIAEMVAASTDFPTEISYHAGTYVCNYLMYNVLHFLRDSGKKAGFVHLPELGNDQDRILSSLKNMIGVLR